MTTQTLTAREPDGANFVYHNNRLLIGWRIISEDDRAEAWLGEISKGAPGERCLINPLNQARVQVYAHSEGLERIPFGLMGIDEAHPSTMHNHDGDMTVSPFPTLGERLRLWLLAVKLALITSGKWKYCERDGGELKTIACLRENAKKRKQPHPSLNHTPSGMDEGKDGHDLSVTATSSSAAEKQSTAQSTTNVEGDVSMESEQLEPPVPAITEQPAVRSTTDREGDISMEGEETAEEPGSAIAKQVALQRNSYGDDVDKALSPCVTQMMDEITAAQKTTTPLVSPEKQIPTPMSLAKRTGTDRMNASTPTRELATPLATSNHEKQFPTAMSAATELGFDIIQQAQDWSLPGTKCDGSLNRFQNQLLAADTVTAKLDLCQPFFKRMADHCPKVTKAVNLQRSALTSSEEIKMPEVIVAAHRHVFNHYEQFEAHVRETVKNFEARKNAIKLLIQT